LALIVIQGIFLKEEDKVGERIWATPKKRFKEFLDQPRLGTRD